MSNTARGFNEPPTGDPSVRPAALLFRFFPMSASEYQKSKNHDSGGNCFDARTKIRHLRYVSESDCDITKVVPKR